MQNPIAAANAALRECNEGLAELLAEFDADRKARRKSCPPPAAKDVALTVTAPAVSVQGVGIPIGEASPKPSRLPKRAARPLPVALPTASASSPACVSALASSPVRSFLKKPRILSAVRPPAAPSFSRVVGNGSSFAHGS